ncbi:siphovirus Gp157 family protein [Yersinia similis]|uniref:siphovirus Gp157 family protein n=1 Tax=Yersinia similis TaxID=367190 RepID=UPI00119E6A1E|nr:siphovirus Gp157 family protein [Yersinia similis]
MSVRTIDLAIDRKKFLEFIETSDDLTPEMIADTLEAIEGSLGDKLDSAMAAVRHIEGQSEICDKESKRLAGRKKSYQTSAGQLRDYMLQCLAMAEMKGLKTTQNTFTAVKGREKLVVDNVESLPDEYVDVASHITYTAKSDEIKSAIENAMAEAKAIAETEGKDISEVFINPVPGARIETGPKSLQVR